MFNHLLPFSLKICIYFVHFVLIRMWTKEKHFEPLEKNFIEQFGFYPTSIRINVFDLSHSLSNIDNMTLA